MSPRGSGRKLRARLSSGPWSQGVIFCGQHGWSRGQGSLCHGLRASRRGSGRCPGGGDRQEGGECALSRGRGLGCGEEGDSRDLPSHMAFWRVHDFWDKTRGQVHEHSPPPARSAPLSCQWRCFKGYYLVLARVKQSSEQGSFRSTLSRIRAELRTWHYREAVGGTRSGKLLVPTCGPPAPLLGVQHNQMHRDIHQRHVPERCKQLQ